MRFNGQRGRLERWRTLRLVHRPKDFPPLKSEERRRKAGSLRGVEKKVTVIDSEADHPSLPIVEGAGSARAVVWPGVGAQARSLHRIELEPGSRTVRLEHPMETVYYVISGTPSVAEPAAGKEHPAGVGSMIFVEPGTPYEIVADGEAALVVGGPCPPDPALYSHLDLPETTGGRNAPSGTSNGPGTVRIFHRDRPDVLMPMIAKDARLIVWAGSGSRTANMNYVNMTPGEENVPHAHPDSEDTIFILAGEGTVEDVTNGVTFEISAGKVVHVPEGIVHAVKANKGSNIESVGGPSPADLQMLEKMGIEVPEE